MLAPVAAPVRLMVLPAQMVVGEAVADTAVGLAASVNVGPAAAVLAVYVGAVPVNVNGAVAALVMALTAIV